MDESEVNESIGGKTVRKTKKIVANRSLHFWDHFLLLLLLFLIVVSSCSSCSCHVSWQSMRLSGSITLCNLTRLVGVVFQEGIITVEGTADKSKECSSSINATVRQDGEGCDKEEDRPDARVHKFNKEPVDVVQLLDHVEQIECQ